MAAITVTPEDVLNVTGSTVTDADVTKALGLIAAATGLDLTDVPDRATARDLANLRLAVIWQAAYGITEAGQADPRVTSVSANGASVGYAQGGSDDDSRWGLGTIAALYLARLSWRRKRGGIRTTRLTPERVEVAREQDLVRDEGPPGWVPMRGWAG